MGNEGEGRTVRLGNDPSMDTRVAEYSLTP